MLELFDTLSAELATITPEELARVERGLQPIGRRERRLGIIDNPDVRSLLALRDRYRKLEDAQLHIVQYTGTSVEEEREAHLQAHRYCSLHKLCMELFWFQCKEEIGGELVWGSSLSIREGWTVIACQAKRGASLPASLSGFLGSLGGIDFGGLEIGGGGGDEE